MLKRKALRKILVTTFALFVLLVVYMLPESRLTKDFNPSTSVEYVDSLETDVVYLLGKNKLLTKIKILLEGKNVEEKVKNMLNSLTINKNPFLPSGFTGIIPEKTKVLDITLTDKIITINFSKEILSISKELEEKMLESIIYSLISLNQVGGVSIKVEGQLLKELPNNKKTLPEVLTKEFGINKEYDFQNKDNINKVVVYYLTTEESKNYYVPVTKYSNDSRDKIQVIIDNLSSSYIYQPNLTSFLNTDIKLLNYSVDEGLMILDFNDQLFDSQKRILEEVIYTISYSAFDNYEINTIMLQVNGKEVSKQSRTILEGKNAEKKISNIGKSGI